MPQLLEKFYKKAPLIFIGAFFLFAPRASAQIIINEIMYDLPGADDKHEWIELYNNGTDQVDLTEWKINDGANHVLNAPPEKGSRGSLTMPAQSFLILADDAQTVISDHPEFSGSVIDTVFDLGNTSAVLKLLDKEGNEINSVSYDKAIGANGNGKTLEWDSSQFKESYSDSGTLGYINSVLNSAAPSLPAGQTSASPEPSDAPSKTPSATPSPIILSNQVLINEFFPAPPKDQEEWVELYNFGEEEINLDGWKIGDSSTREISIGEKTIKPGEFLLISLGKGMLNNSGDQVRLIWPTGKNAHSVTYQKAEPEKACARFDDGWQWTDKPTPGEENKLLSVRVATQKNEPETASIADQKGIAETVSESQKAETEPKKAKEEAIKTEGETYSPVEEKKYAAINEPAKAVFIKDWMLLVFCLVLAALSAGFLIFLKRKPKES